MQKIGIIGTRSRDTEEDYNLCEKMFFEIYKEGDMIVSGGCPKGGDRFAEVIAKKYQIPITIFYAQWNKHDKGAGFIRNTDIAKDSNIIIAVVSKDRTGGTEDTIKKAEKLGKSIIIVGNSNKITYPIIEDYDSSSDSIQ